MIAISKNIIKGAMFMAETKYIKVLIDELNKSYSQPNSLWNYAEDNTLSSDWLFNTPTNSLGKKYNEIPMPVKGNDPDFHLQPCEDSCVSSLSVALKSSVKVPGGQPKKFSPGHSYSFYESIYELIISAEKFVDITTLSPFTGYFLSAIRNAITYISNKEENKRPIIRILYSNPLPNIPPLDVKNFLTDLTRDINENSKMEIYVSILRSSFTSWNHSKIIAVDGIRSIVGGHNMWGEHYLDSNPVFDVSMENSGTSTLHAHCYADDLWDYMIWRKDPTPRLLFSYDKKEDLKLGAYFPDFKKDEYLHAAYTFNTFSKKNEISLDAFPDKNIFKNIKQSLSNKSSGNIPILSVGRRAAIDVFPKIDSYVTTHIEPSDDMMIKLISLAQKNIRMSLQAFHLLYGLVAAYNNKLFVELGKAIERGVDIYIVISNPGAIAGGLGSFSAPYDGENPDEINAKLFEVMVTDLNMVEITAKNLINTHFNVASLRYSSDETYPNNIPISNHAKTFMVDDTVFYIGSQNQYICNLNEFGYIVESSDKAQEYKNLYWTPLWEQSQRKVSKLFSDDVKNEESAEAMAFIFELKKNKRLKKIWESTLLKHKYNTSEENLAEINQQLNAIIINAGFATTMQRVVSTLDTPFFKEERSEHLPSKESDRFVLDLLTNKQLLIDFSSIVDKSVDSFDVANKNIISFLKLKGYDCNASQVVTSFDLLRNHILEYWCGNYDAWCTNDGGKSFDESILQFNSSASRNLITEDIPVLNGPSLIITGNLGVTVDGVKIIKPIYDNGVLSWDASNGNTTSGHITFSEITRPGLMDNFVGCEFYGTLVFSNNIIESKNEIVSYYGRIHDRLEQELANKKYDYIWYITSILGSLALIAISGIITASCSKKRFDNEKSKRDSKHKDDDHYIEFEPLISKQSSLDESADSDYANGEITDERHSELRKRNQTKSKKQDEQDKSETSVYKSVSMASDLKVFDIIRKSDYKDLVSDYNNKINSLSKDLPWSFCQTEIDANIELQVMDVLVDKDEDFSEDIDTFAKEIQTTDFERQTSDVIDDFVSSSMTSQLPELDYFKAKALLSTEVIYPAFQKVISVDSDTSYLQDSVRSSILKQKDHYLTENTATIQQKLSEVASVLVKTTSEVDSSKEELLRVEEELKVDKDNIDLQEQKKKLDAEIDALVEKQKKEESDKEDLSQKDEKNKHDMESNSDDRKDIEKRKSEKGQAIFERGL
ncbi:MAG TPA: hypothetical protein DEP72_09410 [Clostridiales bacterium]|nr:MAG: hypothetical protein A2Y18_04020 [Clostridiales bacterium GWD2_32_19]HCC08358.1 hypothetical protein [Clostridiales bacterium]